LGDGTTTDRTVPVQVSGLTNVVAIAGGGYHSLAVKKDGTVWTWGNNSYGQLGDGTTTQRLVPVQVSGLTNIKDVAGGQHYCLAVKNDGTVWAWGHNGEGELGDGTTVARRTPVQVSGLTGMTDVAAGIFHSLAARADTTPPETTIVSGPDGTINVRTASFGFSSSEANSSFECSLDGAAFSTCTSPKSYADLPDAEHTFRVRATDAAGNVDPTAAQRSFTVDATPPDTYIPSGPDGPTNDHPPTFSFSGSDNLAGSVDLLFSHKIDDGPWSGYSALTSATLGDTAGLGDGSHTFSVRAKETAGNVDNSPAERDFVVDTTRPSVNCGTADGLWHKEDVSISCTASDDPSGLANPADASFSLSSSVADGTKTDNAQTNSREVCDVAGNCATAGPIGGNRIDKRDPDIIINTPLNGAEYRLNATVTASYACSDGGSNVASCSGFVNSGAGIDTASVGSKVFTVEATDKVGNPASESRTYGVVYDFKGFFSPVDNLPVFNQVKAGSAVPVKFSLSGNQGPNIFAEGYPRVHQLSCDTQAPIDDIEQTVSAASSSLSYDATADRYNYVWKTDKAWANSCRQLVLKLNDGTEHRADFRFPK
jgi:hypothetical protein